VGACTPHRTRPWEGDIFENLVDRIETGRHGSFAVTLAGFFTAGGHASGLEAASSAAFFRARGSGAFEGASSKADGQGRRPATMRNGAGPGIRQSERAGPQPVQHGLRPIRTGKTVAARTSAGAGARGATASAG